MISCDPKKLTTAVLAVLAFLSGDASAAPIKVLLARSSVSVDSTLVRSTLGQANNTMMNSGLGALQFESAAFAFGTVPLVFDATCPTTTPELMLQCAKSQLETERNSRAADVVLMVVPSLSVCGSVSPGMVNAPFISNDNEDLAYAIVKDDCLVAPSNNAKVASHELGHLLSLEHHNGDPSVSLPTGYPFNHAEEDANDLTVMGNESGLLSGDCPLTSCNINDFFSENGRLFPDGGSAGNSSESNAKLVVSTKSWDVVAEYRPVPGPPQACNLTWEWAGCNGAYSVIVTAALPGYSVTRADYDYQYGTGPWNSIFDGLYTCPGFNPSAGSTVRAILYTASGISQCTVFVPRQDCEEPPW